MQSYEKTHGIHILSKRRTHKAFGILTYQSSQHHFLWASLSVVESRMKATCGVFPFYFNDVIDALDSPIGNGPVIGKDIHREMQINVEATQKNESVSYLPDLRLLEGTVG